MVSQSICIAIKLLVDFHPAGHQQCLTLVSNHSPVQPLQLGIIQLIHTISINSRQMPAA